VPNPISEVPAGRSSTICAARSLNLSPFILFVAGWLGLPGGPLYWTIVPLGPVFLSHRRSMRIRARPRVCQRPKRQRRRGTLRFLEGGFHCLLNLIFLPHQALLCLDAIVRALVRRFITGERLLEWETAAQAELHSTQTDRPLLALTPLVALAVAVLVYLCQPAPPPCAWLWLRPILLLVGISPQSLLPGSMRRCANSISASIQATRRFC
jgi:cyclic beta-1,2-glucan synthetase